MVITRVDYEKSNYCGAYRPVGRTTGDEAAHAQEEGQGSCRYINEYGKHLFKANGKWRLADKKRCDKQAGGTPRQGGTPRSRGRVKYAATIIEGLPLDAAAGPDFIEATGLTIESGSDAFGTAEVRVAVAR